MHLPVPGAASRSPGVPKSAWARRGVKAGCLTPLRRAGLPVGAAWSRGLCADTARPLRALGAAPHPRIAALILIHKAAGESTGRVHAPIRRRARRLLQLVGPAARPAALIRRRLCDIGAPAVVPGVFHVRGAEALDAGGGVGHGVADPRPTLLRGGRCLAEPLGRLEKLAALLHLGAKRR